MTISNQDLFKISNTTFPIQDQFNRHIKVLEIPQYFGYGNNSFLIGVKQGTFKRDTLLNVFFLDNTNNNVPVTVTQFRQKQFIRCYINITKQHPVGSGKLIILGILDSKNPIVTQKYKDVVNIKHQRSIYVNPNYKTPSVLRFRTNPTVQFGIDQKQLFKFQTTIIYQDLPINNISINKVFPDYFCLNLKKNAFEISSSVYFQKFLQKQYVTNSLQSARDLNMLFSGSVESQTILNGFYYGNIELNTSIPLKSGNINISDSYFNVGGQNSGLQYIKGTNVQSVVFSQPERESKTKTQYQLYVKNNNGLNVNLLQFDQTQRFSGSKQYLKLIDYDVYVQRSTNLFMQTRYFSGSTHMPIQMSSSVNRTVFSQHLQVLQNASTYGHYRDLSIRNYQKYQQQLLAAQKTYENFQFYGNISFISQGRTILNGCYITNSYLNLGLNNQKITFDSFVGVIYSKRLVTKFQYQSDKVANNSRISGSLRGKGTLKCVSDSSTDRVNSKQKKYKSQQVITLSQGQTFTGVAYNVDVQLQYFSGSIWTGSLYDTQDTKVLQYIGGVNIKQATIYGGIGTIVDINSIQQIQFKDEGSNDYPPTFSFNNGSLQVIFNQTINFSKSSTNTGNLNINGNFHYTSSQSQTVERFSGVFKPQDARDLQLCNLQNIQLEDSCQKLFNTKQCYVFQQDYQKLYIPVGLSTKKGLDLQQLYKRIQQSKIKTKFQYRNILDTNKKISNPNIIPLKVSISNIDIYSGYLSQAQLYYNNTSNKDNYQLLSTFQINQIQNTPVIKSIQIPKQYFSNQTNKFLLKYKDSKNRYCQQQSFLKQNNVSFDFQTIKRTYQNINTKLIQPITPIVNINGKSGDVILNTYDIQYFSNDLPVQTHTVGNLLDAYINSWQYNAGVLNSPQVTTSSNGNLIVGPGQYLVYQDSTYNSQLLRFSIAQYTTFSSIHQSCSHPQCTLVNGTTNYIVFSKQLGHIYSTTNKNIINAGSIVPVLSLYKDGNAIHSIDSFQTSKASLQKINLRLLNTRTFQPQCGTLILGQSPSVSSSIITITSGAIWYGVNRIPISSSNSQNQNALLYYKHNDAWYSSSISTYDNLRFNDHFSGLVGLNADKYNVNWIYKKINKEYSDLIVILSNLQYDTIDQASNSSLSQIPDFLKTQGILIGRAIFQKQGLSAQVIQSAFNNTFTTAGVSSVSFVDTNNGIKGIVNNPTSSPQLQLWLEHITVSSVTSSGNITTNGQLVSTITGSAPFIVNSNTLVNNLNAQYINGMSSSQIPFVEDSIENRLVKWGSGSNIQASSLLFDNGIIFTCSSAFTSSGGIYISSNGLQSIGDISGSAKLTINGSSSFKNNMSVDGNLTIQQGHGLFQYSDRHLKQNIIQIDNSIQLLTSLSGVEFNWRRTKTKDFGMIAQQVQKVIPQMVFQQGQYKQINYTKLIPFLLQGIKQLNQKLKQLQCKINYN